MLHDAMTFFMVIPWSFSECWTACSLRIKVRKAKEKEALNEGVVAQTAMEHGERGS